MSSMTIYPSNAEGVASAPSSIDEALRAIMLAALMGRSVAQTGTGQDVLTMLNCLERLGVKYRKESNRISFYTSPVPCKEFLDCTLSTKTLNLLLPLCLAMGGKYQFMFDNKVKDHIELSWLESQQIKYSVDKNIIVIEGKLTQSHIETYNEDMADGLLVALTLIDSATLERPKSESNTKWSLTQYILDKFGFNVSDYPVYSISKKTNTPTDYTYCIGGDYRSSAYLMLFGFLAGNVGITGLLADYPLSERHILNQLKQLRINVHEINGAVFAKKSRLGDIIINACEYIDLLPLIVVLSCFSRGKCVIKNTLKLHAKERSELLKAVEVLQSIGADVIQIADDFIITGKKKLFGGFVDVQENKHLAWSVAAAALCCETPVTLSGVPKDIELKSTLQALSVLVQ